MDSELLVSPRYIYGLRIVQELSARGLTIPLAAWGWLDSGFWRLFLVCRNLEDRNGINPFHDLAEVRHEIGESEFSLDTVHFVSEKEQLAVSLDYQRSLHPSMQPLHLGETGFGWYSGREWIIYPPLGGLTHTDLSDEHKELLIDLYNQTPLSADDLPYSSEMIWIYQRFLERTQLPLAIRDVYKALKNLSRAGKLGGKIRPREAEAAPA
jgi:hypothetical protein